MKRETREGEGRGSETGATSQKKNNNNAADCVHTRVCEGREPERKGGGRHAEGAVFRSYLGLRRLGCRGARRRRRRKEA